VATELWFRTMTATVAERVRRLRNFVNGEYVDPSEDAFTDIVDPATGSVVAQAPDPRCR